MVLFHHDYIKILKFAILNFLTTCIYRYGFKKCIQKTMKEQKSKGRRNRQNQKEEEEESSATRE